MSVKYWGDPVSQPCRTVEYVLRKCKVDYENNFAEIFKVTRTEEYKKDVNPRGHIPTLEHDGTKIYESAAQIRYLLDTFDKEEVLLPRKDLKARSKVDSLLDWNNTTVRPTLTGALKKIKLNVAVFGAPAATEEEEKEEMAKVHSLMEEIEELLGDKKFLTGDDMSISDVQIYNEVELCKAILSLDLDKYGKLNKWRDLISQDELVKALDEEMNKRLSEMA